MVNTYPLMACSCNIGGMAHFIVLKPFYGPGPLLTSTLLKLLLSQMATADPHCDIVRFTG